MALIDCVECGKEISDTTGGHCPHCGYNPRAAKPGELTVDDGASIFMILVVLIGLAGPILLLEYGMVILWIIPIVGFSLVGYFVYYIYNDYKKSQK